jgi:hypothetical protein
LSCYHEAPQHERPCYCFRLCARFAKNNPEADPRTPLATDLARFSSEKILILAGRFAPNSAPPPASANAA